MDIEPLEQQHGCDLPYLWRTARTRTTAITTFGGRGQGDVETVEPGISLCSASPPRGSEVTGLDILQDLHFENSSPTRAESG